ncbi:MAG: hypothetical protein ACREQZ_08985 [Woeseiaceae bacterium]
MRKPRRQRSTLFLILFLASWPATAERVPALFGDGSNERHFRTLLGFPEVSGDVSLVMLCFSQIEDSGKMTETGCLIRNNAEKLFFDAIDKAAKKAQLVPARIDGRARKIYLQFRVEFIKEGDSRRINMYANPGDAENIEAYGEDHVAAQRVIGKEAWMKVCPSNAQYGVTARAHVSVEGIASSTSLAHGYGIVPTGPCQQAIIEAIETSAYAPAMVDGEAVPSAYVEPFSN